MKKLIYTTALLLTFENAQAKDNKYYLGLEYQNSQIGIEARDTSSLGYIINENDYYETNLNNINYFVGYNFNKNLALEVSYFQDSSSKSNNNTGLVYTSGTLNSQAVTTDSDLSIKVLGLDVIYNHDINKFRIFGLTGLSYIQANVDENFNDGSNYTNSANGLGFNIGGGMGYKVTENTLLRAKVKYTSINNLNLNSQGISQIEDIVSYKVGVSYSF